MMDENEKEHVADVSITERVMVLAVDYGLDTLGTENEEVET